jgi:hypothetical protein
MCFKAGHDFFFKKNSSLCSDLPGKIEVERLLFQLCRSPKFENLFTRQISWLPEICGLELSAPSNRRARFISYCNKV